MISNSYFAGPVRPVSVLDGAQVLLRHKNDGRFFLAFRWIRVQLVSGEAVAEMYWGIRSRGVRRFFNMNKDLDFSRQADVFMFKYQYVLEWHNVTLKLKDFITYWLSVIFQK